MSRKTFYIIDGHAHIYRAYYAPFRDLTSPTGEPTKATYVFVQMLLSLIEQRKPDYLAMAIDSGDETVFRKQIYPQYKSSRRERPDDFTPQETRILQIVKDVGVPIFVLPGFEADDLIATMADRLGQESFDTYIVSKDKDLRQIVSDHVFLYDAQGDQVIDAADIEREHGYTPAQAIDIQTLIGDKTDDVPGIPGIGEKTAARLIAQYGSADGVLAHKDELTPKQRENVEKYAANIPLARQLVTLKKDVPLEFDPESCRFSGLDSQVLKASFQELGFTTLLKRLYGAQAVEKPARTSSASAQFSESLFSPADSPEHAQASSSDQLSHSFETSESCDYQLVNTQEGLARLAAALRAQKRFAFDTETTGLSAVSSELVGMSFSWERGSGYYVPVRAPQGNEILPLETVLDAIKPILEDVRIEKVGHNIKYDLLVMRQLGVHVRGVVLDSMVAMFLLDAGRLRYNIDTLALELLNFQKIATADLIGKGRKQITMDQVELGLITRYAAEDADIALRLANLLGPRLDAIPTLKQLNDTLEVPLIDVLVEMEHNGIAVDPAILKEQSRVLGERIDDLRERIIESAGVEFNVDSPKQLGEVLFNHLKLRVVKKTKTGFSTDAQVLEELSTEHECPRLVLEYRGLVKLKNTYLDSLSDYVCARTGRIHTSFNQIGASTGRLSSSDPNLQNVPVRTDEGRRIRMAFVPADAEHHVLLSADYSQIELRVLAHFTQEPALVSAFAANEDIHQAVAAEVFDVPLSEVTREQRSQAKVINFGIIYGVTAFGLSRRIDGLSVSDAHKLIEDYHKRFPGIAAFLQRCIEEAKAKGYVETILGRRRPIYDISSANPTTRNAAERVAINSVVQGSAADLIKVAMLNVHRRIQREHQPSRMLLQVHDELVFEAPIDRIDEQVSIISGEMIAAGKVIGLNIPLKVETGWGKNWQEVK